ncbi:hypothetical protein KCTCHS21_23240 [Cohnella abietis]|uniref:Uncharacterized protein n=1 Tax=Cohnella abietis TaxID=2507935 RepID=A0A3T1D4M0_9BACL|nr:hypothetical protein KCTCHS21_23240 [Cohnella abietis]
MSCHVAATLKNIINLNPQFSVTCPGSKSFTVSLDEEFTYWNNPLIISKPLLSITLTFGISLSGKSSTK